MLVLSFLPFSSQRVLHMKAKSQWAGLPFLSPGLLTSCLTLAFRPATVSVGWEKAGPLSWTPGFWGLQFLKGKPRCSLDTDAKAEALLTYQQRQLGTLPNEWMNKWWPHSQLCGAKQMETLAISLGKGTIGTPGPKGKNSINFESVVCCQITQWSMSLSPP